MTPAISIIIVNWNADDFLRRCIESLINYPPSIPWEIIVVDNASTDNSLGWVRSQSLPNLRLIENSENLGFGTANNQGMKLSEAPLLFLLNNDAEVRQGTIDRLIATLNSDARIGACGPRILNTDGSLQSSVWPTFPTPVQMIVTAFRLYRLMPARVSGELLLGDYWDHAQRRTVGIVMGAAMLVRREVVNDVGGFDERLHMYFEDNEWCLRMVRAGWQIVFEPAAVVVHHKGKSSDKRWDDRQRLLAYHESKFWFHRNSLSRKSHLANLVTMCALSMLQLPWRKLRGKPTNQEDLILRLHYAELRNMLRNHGPGDKKS